MITSKAKSLAIRMSDSEYNKLIKAATAHSKRNGTTLNMSQFIRDKIFNRGEFRVERKKRD